MHFTPPTSNDLEQLKQDLGYSSTQMAELFGLASGRQWRKYTSTTDRRDMGLHMLFFAMARLELTPDVAEKIFDRMRRTGATVEAREIEEERQP